MCVALQPHSLVVSNPISGGNTSGRGVGHRERITPPTRVFYGFKEE